MPEKDYFLCTQVRQGTQATGPTRKILELTELPQGNGCVWPLSSSSFSILAVLQKFSNNLKIVIFKVEQTGLDYPPCLYV